MYVCGGLEIIIITKKDPAPKCRLRTSIANGYSIGLLDCFPFYIENKAIMSNFPSKKI